MNIAKMMQQANKMQSDMKAMQEKLKSSEVEVTLSGVAVKISGDGKKLNALTIDASLIDPNDKETLEDLIIAAINQAQQKADELSAAEAQKIMGGLKLPPGIQLPF
jgi:DNA-binding YbaB/EbfC family protein